MALTRTVFNVATGESEEVDMTPEEEALAEAQTAAAAAAVPQRFASTYAIAQLSVNAGDITGIDVASKFSAAIYLDVGSYLAFFADTLPDAQYIARGDSASATIRVTERSTDYIAISAVDAAGQPVDPAEFSIEIVRVI